MNKNTPLKIHKNECYFCTLLNGVNFRSDDSKMECLDVMPEMGSASHILSDKQIINLNNLLPPRCIGAKWNLRYSSRKNGTSLGTLIRNCSTEGENRNRF